MTAWQLGIDIGGTFTDVVAFRPGGEPDGGPGDGPGGDVVRLAKVRSRPGDPLASVLAALEAVGIDWAEVADLVHGTTVITNAIVEGRLAKVALVATAGFADTLAIGRQNRRHLYRLDLPPKAPPQVPEELRFEIAERLDQHGTVLVEPSDDDIEALAERIAASGVEAVAVVLLHAYANPAHEARLGKRLAEAVPYVALSHRVNPEAREFERASTTALSAGVMPLAARHLDRLDAARPKASRLHLFHSAGGMAAPSALRDLPLGLAFSGPAAGVAAAERIARDLGIANAISLDMGGTTTDVCLIAEGHAEIRSDRALAGRPLRMPMVAVESIGAGGGSIARLDTGTLRVGPESAGAEPGPACYALGGTAATVTDANAILGYLDFARPVGGLRLDRAAAEAALTPLAEEIGVGLPELALGIVRVANASMTRALRRVTVERGIDGRQCHLLAFGGAGPMHAVELARAFGIGRVVVPHLSSVFSALGCVTAELRYTQQQTLRMASGAWDQARLDALHRPDGSDGDDRIARTDQQDLGRSQGLQHARRRCGCGGRREIHRLHVIGRAIPHQVLLEVAGLAIAPQQARGGFGFGHRQQLQLQAEGRGDLARDLGERCALTQASTALDVCGQVLVAQVEPRVGSISLETLDRRERVSGEAPAGLLVGEARQRVHDRIEVRRDVKSVELLVVARVDDHRQLVGGEDFGKPQRELRASDASGQRNHRRFHRVLGPPLASLRFVFWPPRRTGLIYHTVHRVATRREAARRDCAMLQSSLYARLAT
ncbi:MAG: hydantoinase/oxoprolinase family protein [Proteobacteria bacterium]|nr:hydantoinase/oxoprolinase family protein [Pseudomonadota bacterium]